MLKLDDIFYGKLNAKLLIPLHWRHKGRNSVSNHQPHDYLLNRLFGRRSKKTSMLRVTGLCAGNSPVTGEFPAQMASNAENVSIWWRHHASSAETGIFWANPVNIMVDAQVLCIPQPSATMILIIRINSSSLSFSRQEFTFLHLCFVQK